MHSILSALRRLQRLSLQRGRTRLSRFVLLLRSTRIFHSFSMTSASLCKTAKNAASFQCATSSTCITPKDLCNNVTDCVHGEDEHDLICGHYCEWPSLNTCTSMRRRSLVDEHARFVLDVHLQTSIQICARRRSSTAMGNACRSAIVAMECRTAVSISS